MTFNELNRMSQKIKEKYPSGTRILLCHMGDDPNPIPDNTRGTVKFVDDIGTIFCDFDNGRTLGLTLEDDVYRPLTPEELEEEMDLEQSM